MSDGPECKACGQPVSLERGITVTGDLNAAGMDYYCAPCAPNQGRGYTLADLQRMREERKTERAKYEMSLMDRVGPDVYFAVKGDD